jgi:hypothetical protein
MKKILTLIMLMGAMTAAEAQTMVLNLDSCRAMALRNNKQINATPSCEESENSWSKP